MQKTYHVSGMTCNSCKDKVTNALTAIKGVNSVLVDTETKQAVIKFKKEISLGELQNSLDSKYQIKEQALAKTVPQPSHSWYKTYQPVLLIFTYLTIVTLGVEYRFKTFELARWCSHFMAGFFLVFSFFKLLDVKGFSNSYQMYDVIAKKFPFWGVAYPFLEFALGIAFILQLFPVALNLVTLVIMSVSLIGVLKAVFSKKKIKCACLGSVFNLPMSTITIIEDGLMICMSMFMLTSYL